MILAFTMPNSVTSGSGFLPHLPHMYPSLVKPDRSKYFTTSSISSLQAMSSNDSETMYQQNRIPEFMAFFDLVLGQDGVRHIHQL